MTNPKLNEAYKKRYKMRALGQKGQNTVVSIPRVVLEREAEKSGLSVEEFIERYRAIAHFDNFEGVFYAFEEAPQTEEQNGLAASDTS